MIIFYKKRKRERESKRALLSLIVFHRSHQSLFLLSRYRGTKGMHNYNRGNSGCIITTGEQGIKITTVGTGDTYYNRGNRGCIITKRN